MCLMCVLMCHNIAVYWYWCTHVSHVCTRVSQQCSVLDHWYRCTHVSQPSTCTGTGILVSHNKAVYWYWCTHVVHVCTRVSQQSSVLVLVYSCVSCVYSYVTIKKCTGAGVLMCL